MKTKCYTKSVLAAAVMFGAVCLLPMVASAQVAGICSECHTMHNSQGGNPMSTDVSGADDSTVFRSLTKGDCVGCHTGTNDGTGNIPFVMDTAAPSYDAGGSASGGNTLAGGNFYWARTGGTDSMGHNVLGISGGDGDLGDTPPGGSALASQLTCAGTTGCHGAGASADQYVDISGAHHTDDSTIDGSSVGKSYRFLDGVLGLEDSDWEYTVAANDHNQYKGVDRSGSADSTAAAGSISTLCAKCHGAYHASATAHGTDDTMGISYSNNMTSPWVRHPTDFDMNNVSGKEYGDYGGTGVNAYVPEAPVASADVSAVKANVLQAADDAIVICVSCHRAHGSPNADLLRWDYSTMDAHAGTGSGGCFACHTTKDS